MTRVIRFLIGWVVYSFAAWLLVDVGVPVWRILSVLVLCGLCGMVLGLWAQLDKGR